MNIEHVLNNGYEKRLDFAYKGIKRFYNELDKDMKYLFNNNEKGETNICVYGNSQVGKTTLILKLIGLKDDKVDAVGKILRGGRKLGNSATLIPTIYGKSEDDFFYISSNGEEEKKLNKYELSQEINDYRENQEKIKKVDSFKIKIPKKYFEIKDKEINIIDLPGIDSSEKKEWNTVNYLINKFLPISNLVLIVDRADQINNFNKIEISKEYNWRKMHNEFRIILSRSISANSVKNEIIKTKKITLEKYLKIFNDEIKRCNINIPNLEYIYPLEYGESFENLEDEIKEKIRPVLDELYAKLNNEILESKNEYNTLLRNLRVYEKIKTVKKNVEKQYADVLQEISGSLKEQYEYRSYIVKKKKKEEEKRISIKRKEDELKRFTINLNSNIEKMMKVDEAIKIEEYNVDGLKQWINNRRKGLIKEISMIKEATRNYDRNWKIGENSYYIICSNLDGIISKFNKYMMKNYLFESSKKKDIKVVEEAVVRTRKNIGEELLKEINLKSEIKKEIEYKLKRIETKILSREKMLQIINSEIAEIESREKNIQESKKIFNKKIEKEYEKAKKFMKYIKQEYEIECEKIIKKINGEKCEEIEMIRYMEYLYLISDEMVRLEQKSKC